MESITPEQAHTFLRDAERTGKTARGNAPWPHVTLQLILAVSASMYLLAVPSDAPFNPVPPIALIVWNMFGIVIAVAYGRVAKPHFGRRWTIFMVLWTCLWCFGMVDPFAYARLAAGIVIMVSAMLASMIEINR